MHLARLRAFLPYGSIIALLAVTYAMSIGNGFVEWDDRLLLLDNPRVHGLSLHNIYAAFTTYDPELYIPLTLLSYQVTYAVAGLAPWAYHLGNLLLHGACALLVLGIARRLTHSPAAALTAAALFAVHPLNTEAVAWASARKDVLSGALALGSILLWLRWRDGKPIREYAWSIVLFALALMAKVSVIGLPLALLLIDWARGRRLRLADARAIAPFLALSIAFGIVAIIGKGQSNDGLLLEKLLIGAKATGFYALKLLVPSGLSALYPYTQPIALASPDIAMGTAWIVIMSIAAFLLRRKAPWLAAGWCIALVFLVPSFSNFAKGKDLLHDVYFGSDRYAYLAAIPAFIAAGVPVAWLSKSQPRAASAAIGALIAMLAVRAALQASTWHDSMGLFRNVLKTYPTSHVALNNVGTLLFQQGDRDKALQYYQASLAVRPNSMAYFNLGVIAQESGLHDRAIEFYRKALEQNPGYSEAQQRLEQLGQ